MNEKSIEEIMERFMIWAHGIKEKNKKISYTDIDMFLVQLTNGDVEKVRKFQIEFHKRGN